MSYTEQQIEQDIQDKGCNKGPRITPDMVDSMIVSVQYHVFAGTTATVCCLTLTNGFTLIGHSSCISPENFNEEVGRKIAFDRARSQIMPLEAYLLNAKIKGQV